MCVQYRLLYYFCTQIFRSVATAMEDASIIVITLLAHITVLAEVDINFNLINALVKVSNTFL